MAQPSETVRAALLEAAEHRLIASSDDDISTRAVCDDVGVTQPVMYRIFGDKRGLLDALAEVGLERYAARKADLEASEDPVEDLRAGWDHHLAFAAENPALYRLMFAPRPWTRSSVREGIATLIGRTLMRCAASGALAVPVSTASAMVLSANIGLALNRFAEPEMYGDPAISDALRDGVFAAIGAVRSGPPDGDPLSAAATRLEAQLAIDPGDALAPEEIALLRRWLARIGASRTDLA